MYKVYKHTSPNGKVYIGITSKKCEYRWNYGRGYRNNRHFDSAIQKYGWENFKHEIVADGLTKEEAQQKEIELISFYHSDDKDFGYNLMHGGELAKPKHSAESIEKMRQAKLGKTASEETKKKHSLAMMGRVCSAETRRKLSASQKGIPKAKHTEEWKRDMSNRFRNNTWNVRAVNQLSLSNDLIATYPSVKQAERETGFDNRNIIAVCKGKRKTAYGYIWEYVGGK